MAWIKPDTDIWILKGIPWSNDYHHTMWWTNSDYQYNYMVSKRKYVLSTNTYQRVSDGTLRVNEPAEGLYECNYLMFRNHAYGDKWFYAFITDVQYVNDGCCQISYEMDPLQTWFFECFGSDGTDIPTVWVVREHSETDEPGDNLTPEPFTLNDYTFGLDTEVIPEIDGAQYPLTDGYAIVAVCDTGNPDVGIIDKILELLGLQINIGGEWQTGNIYQGNFQGSTLYAYKLPSYSGTSGEPTVPNDLDKFLKQFITNGNPDAVLSIYFVPSFIIEMYGGINSDNSLERSYNGDDSMSGSHYGYTTLKLDKNNFANPDAFGSYYPKNKKLLTYPYYFCTIFGPDGENLIIRYEYCEDHIPEVALYGSISQPVCACLRPINYAKEHSGMNSKQIRYNEQLCITNFPTYSWQVDSYELWLQQTSIPRIIGGVQQGISIATGLAANPAAGGAAAAGVANDLLSVASESYTASIQADVCRGSQTVGNPASTIAKNTFHYNCTKINEENAKQIDSYFTRYGYAQNCLLKPNLLSRKYFNYIRTVDMDIKGDIPNTDKNKIESMFDNGFTAWHFDNPLNDSDFGNYDVDNSIK